ncbi:hypothetical protein Glove_208g176 [Diversispora epigaea]|uniref:G-protein coupled receptors family 1 profile domain-containing protein n=1 Tax=Diversispora epigaea TaxID=1348612 RepID=A0A397IIR7_9GLOM|nr:hypothetical protein Glove_208g176 [Diversispora epigaea]
MISVIIIEILLNITWIISLISSIYMAFVFWRGRKNPLMNIFCIFVVLMSADVLLSLIYLNDLKKAPREFCIFQALMLQFCAYATGITALCFSMQTYRRIVLNSRESHRMELFYYSSCILFPCIMTTILAIFTIKYDSIGPRGMTCDVINPIWMRLIGYTGPNLILCPLGMYWNVRTVLKVFRQLDKIDTSIPSIPSPSIPSIPKTPFLTERDNSSKSDSTTLFEEPINKNTSFQEESTNEMKSYYPLVSLPTSKSAVSNKSPDNAKYRVATKRLVSFALGFLLINVIASFSTLLDVIMNKPMSSRISSSDVMGSLIGIGIFLIFRGSRDN